jgi:hypothetical protein
VKRELVQNVSAHASKGKGGSLSRIRSGQTEYKLAGSIASVLKKQSGRVDAVRFRFARHGVYFHYGTGRGYVRQGNSLVRGSRLSREQFNRKRSEGHTRESAAKLKNVSPGGGGINRTPVDWLESVMEKKIAALADIVQEYYGDEAMRRILDELDRIGFTGKK